MRCYHETMLSGLNVYKIYSGDFRNISLQMYEIAGNF
jgi:hypothetical protein